MSSCELSTIVSFEEFHILLFSPSILLKQCVGLILERSQKVKARMNFFQDICSYWAAVFFKLLLSMSFSWITLTIRMTWLSRMSVYWRWVESSWPSFSVSTVNSALSRFWVAKWWSITMKTGFLRLHAMTVGTLINRYMCPSSLPSWIVQFCSICCIPGPRSFKRPCRISAERFGHSCTSGCFDYTKAAAPLSL